VITLEAGTKLGHYEIRSQIGAGGMGEVYLAQDTVLERHQLQNVEGIEALKRFPRHIKRNRPSCSTIMLINGLGRQEVRFAESIPVGQPGKTATL